MRNMIKSVGLLMFMIIGQFTYGQSDKDKAFEKGRAAIELMDNGKIDESIKLLEEAQNLDPETKEQLKYLKKILDIKM